jgi:predicted RNA-binding Zn ribbon-like protein
MPKNRQITERATPAQVRYAGETLVKYLNAIEGHPELNQSILVRDLQRQLAQGSMNFEQCVKAAILFIRLEDVIAALWSSADSARIRQCACGCGIWFYARPRQRRCCTAACRQKLWELGMTEEQKDGRRMRMKLFRRGYYDRNFKAIAGP